VEVREQSDIAYTHNIIPSTGTDTSVTKETRGPDV